jgi:hypothetical protein
MTATAGPTILPILVLLLALGDRVNNHFELTNGVWYLRRSNGARVGIALAIDSY